MKDLILNFIKERNYVSFAELSRAIPGFSGEHRFYNKAFKNVVLWDGISEEGINALKWLLSESKIFVKEADINVYLADGDWLNYLPVARFAKSYKTIHWLPIVFSCNRSYAV